MKEEKYLTELFKEARKEPTQLSFQKVAKRWNNSLSLPLNHLIKFLNTYGFLSILVIAGSYLLIFNIDVVNNQQDDISGLLTKYHKSEFKLQKQKNIDTIISIQKITEKKEEINKSTRQAQVINSNSFIYPPSSLLISSSHTKPIVAPSPYLPKLEFNALPLTKRRINISDQVSIQLKNNIRNDNVIHQAPFENKSNTIQRKQLFVLENTDDLAAFHDLKKTLEDFGIQVSRKSNVVEKEKQITDLFLWLKHPEGLSLKLRGNSFTRFEIEVELNSTDRVHSFRYRFNDQAFTRPVPLNCKGYKTYMFGDHFTGYEGRTSVNLEY